MGRLKATLPIDDRDTFLTRIIRTFAEAFVADVTVVLGYEASIISQAVGRSGLSPRFVVNAGFDDGQFSSLLVGLNAIDRPGVEAMLLTLVDAPLFSAATVRAVVDRYHATRAPIVRPVRGSEHGHPVLIDRTLFHGIAAGRSVARARNRSCEATCRRRATSRWTMTARSWTSTRLASTRKR